MKFACPKCATRYNIADDKLPDAPTLRITCKTCGNVIRVKRKADPTPAPLPTNDFNESTRVASVAELQRMKKESADHEPTGESTRVASISELQRMRAESAGIDDSDSTRVASLSELQKVKAKSAQERAAPAPKKAKPNEPASARGGWYAMIGGKQQGTFTAGQLLAMLERGEVDKRTYVWKSGMADWQRLGLLDELMQQVGHTEAPQGTAMAPSAAPMPENTVAMNAAHLQEELARLRAAKGAEKAPAKQPKAPAPMPADVATAVYKPPAKAKVSESDSEATGLSEAVFLMGEPTGEGMARHGLERPVESKVPTGSNDMSELFAMEEPAAHQPEDSQPVRGDDYLQAPPGEATRVFMATAGIFRRRRQQRFWAVVGMLALAGFTGVIGLDLAGIWTIPGMGLAYEVIGVEDPNAERAVERVESKLQRADLDPDERRRLRERLLGLQTKVESVPKRKSKPGAPASTTEGVEDKKTLDDTQRDLAASIFGDTRKQESTLSLASPDQIRTPNLPEGLTQESIFAVISENNRAMKLCVTEAMRKNERLDGKMEVELTIAATGDVLDVVIATAKYRSSAMGMCTAKRIKAWKFPRFNGEPVTVMFPYVLSAGF